jgi:hypothetical protein
MPHFGSQDWNSPTGLLRKQVSVNGGYNSSLGLFPVGGITGAYTIPDTSVVLPRDGFVRISIISWVSLPDSASGSAGKFQFPCTDALGNSRTLAPITGTFALDNDGAETNPVHATASFYGKAGTTVQLQLNFSVAPAGDGAVNFFVCYEMDR